MHPKIIKLMNVYDVSAEQSTFRELLNECRKNEEFTDVQLQVGDKLFHAHRAVLSLYSPVLKAAISEHWSTTNVCPIGDEFVDVEIMEDLLSFLYTGKIELTPKNVHSVCITAHYLQIQLLFDISLERLCELISTENLLKLLEFSNSYQLEPLRKSCMRFIQEKHEQVFQDSKILELFFKDFKDLIVGLKDHTSGSVFREDTFHFIVRWTEKDRSNRLNDLPSLLENIPLEELSHKFLIQKVSTNSLVNESTFRGEDLIQALSAQKTLERFIVIGKANPTKNASSSMTCYDSEGRIWRRLPNMSTQRLDFSAAVTNQGDIIICGGYTLPGVHERSVQMLDWKTQIWTELFTFPEQIECLHPLVSVHKGCLYVAGGENQRGIRSNKVLCYSFETKQWKYVKSMNRPRTRGKLISHKGYLYAISSGSQTFERYDPSQDKWAKMENIPGRPYDYSWFRAALHQDKIYAFDYRQANEYDPDKNVWVTLPNELPLRKASLVSMSGKLLAVGGYLRASNNINDTIYEFNCSTKMWTEIGKMELGKKVYCSLVGNFI